MVYCRGKEYQTSSRPEAPRAAMSTRTDTETEALCARRSMHDSASSSQTGMLLLDLVQIT